MYFKKTKRVVEFVINFLFFAVAMHVDSTKNTTSKYNFVKLELLNTKFVLENK